MNTLETAIQFGVPTLETCKELNWQTKTSFTWVKYTILDELFLAFNVSLGEEYGTCLKYSYNPYENSFYFHNNRFRISDVNIIHAPQMHEIASLLRNNDNLFLIAQNNKQSYMKISGSYKPQDFMVKIINNHYAEAAAELYLKLKEKGLL